MKYKKSTRFLFTFLLLALMATGLFAKDDLNCLICHQFKGLARLKPDGTLRSFYVDPAKSEASVHAPLTCETCHDYIKQVPHLAENIRPVDCANMCHLENNPALGEDFSHQKLKTAYENSSHGPGNEDAPRCNYCHPQHQMTRLTKAEPRFIVGLCASCHGDEALMKKHDKSAKPVVLYNKGVHRQANYYGNKKAAYCVNCHDPHRVLDYTNPQSPTYKDNRVKICSQQSCHPKATATFANKGAIHNTYGDSLMGLITDYLPPIYFLIIVGTIGFMLFHNGLDFLGFVVRGREVHPPKPKSETRYFTRLTLNERIQHLILLLSFITLVITGAMLKIPREWVLAFTNNLEKAYLVRWYLHRVAAVALASVSLYHIFYLIFSKRGNEQFRELVPGLKDLRDIGGTFKYYFGLAKHKPNYGHFDYKEKI